MENVIFTLGHSNHTTDKFLELLATQEINAVADVRSSPFSRFNPQFNRENVQRSLLAAGIAYVHLGRELGPRSEDPSCYENGRVSYVRLATTALFRKGLVRLREGRQRFRISLMCAEKDPLFCHRAILVSRQLVREGVSVCHILADGALETQAQLESRMLRFLGMPELDLLRTREQLVEDAYAIQNFKMTANVGDRPDNISDS